MRSERKKKGGIDEQATGAGDDEDDELNRLLKQADGLLNDKIRNNLMMEENDKLQESEMKKLNDRRQKYKDRLGQPQNIDEFMQEAKRVIDDQ